MGTIFQNNAWQTKEKKEKNRKKKEIKKIKKEVGANGKCIY